MRREEKTFCFHVNGECILIKQKINMEKKCYSVLIRFCSLLILRCFSLISLAHLLAAECRFDAKFNICLQNLASANVSLLFCLSTWHVLLNSIDGSRLNVFFFFFKLMHMLSG